MRKVYLALAIFLYPIFLYANVSILSISTDGRYVITGNDNQTAFIWDIEKQIYNEIALKAINPYSIFFIPESHNVLIQNGDTNDVYIKNISGKVIKTFNPGFQVYGEAISSDLKTYVAADKLFNVYLFDVDTNKKKPLFVSWCNSPREGVDYDLKNPYKGNLPNGCTEFVSSLPNFHFTNDNKYLVFGVGAPVIVWNLDNFTWKQLKSSWPNSNTISPDGGYASTADSNGHGVIYNFENEKYKTLSWIRGVINDLVKSWFDQNTADALTSINYIADDLILITSHGIPKPFLYVSLYNPNKMQNLKIEGKDYPINKAIKYIPLVKNPNAQYPADNGIYPQTQSFMPVVATSSEAHIMVIAQANGGGIMVYKFNPDDQTLKLIWAPEL
jgi:WD40 repeat protein